ncbi:MAG: NADH-quinone oxidoreductase subunit NuoE [Clostridia bacterium]|nr:NADH-quinone oxidoreductase subunit NuoE [Clostridia bacterium]
MVLNLKSIYNIQRGGVLVEYKKLVDDYTSMPGGLIEAFHAIQNEHGYLPEAAINEAAEAFKISAAEAYGVATFYSMFSVKPRGKYVIRICRSAPCHVEGAQEVIAALEQELGICMGGTSNDGLFSLEFTECVGQCQERPVITINGEPYAGVTPGDVPGILNEIRNK